jgi:hypothetical protein
MKRLLWVLTATTGATLLLTSCLRKEYTCYCERQEQWGKAKEEMPLGFMSNNAAQRKCNDHQYKRTEELRGTPKTIRCKVITDL